MDHLTYQRAIVVIAFLGILLLLRYVIVRNQATFRGKLTSGRRLKVIETLSLGLSGQVILLEADGRPLLVLSGRKGGLEVRDLPVSPPPHHRGEDTA